MATLTWHAWLLLYVVLHASHPTCNHGRLAKAVGTLSVKDSKANKCCESAGNVVQTLVMSSLVPTTIFAFTLSLPYLPPAPPLGPNFWLGTAVLVAGLFTFNSPQWRPMLQKKLQSKAA